MLNKVIEITAIAPFSLRVRFNDGRTGVHDCTAEISHGGTMTIPLREPSYFARVFLEQGAPTWPNGYDMCPDWLHMEMAAAGELRTAAAE